MKLEFVMVRCRNTKLGQILVDRALDLGYSPDDRVSKDLHEFDLALPISGFNHHKIMTCKVEMCERATLISLDDFLFTEKYRWKEIKKPVRVTLNNEYTAEVTNETIKVGCTTFPISKLAELNNALKEYNKQ